MRFKKGHDESFGRSGYSQGDEGVRKLMSKKGSQTLWSVHLRCYA